jgi:putative transposase
MIATWERAWDDFVPFLAFPVELRQIVYTTNAIESLNARFRKAVRHRGHFPTDPSLAGWHWLMRGAGLWPGDSCSRRRFGG